ncbi:FliH/SctL family protein [Anaerobiospirillum succiniciproducens]|uniref:FliH/SctL family protein n=1 Tax=Anaerobiospirillum succiniciproducens TaxID=13335 RepID=UPI002352904D|nr:FliH/SctL family protein [Anaerobiospirillum succiniciproducens]MCI6863538.1 hypothetical protein [Anaerobiospirillum succiniciproducens]
MPNPLGKSDHAFGSLNDKIDPNSVVESVKENIHPLTYKEATVMQGAATKGFTPMQWPLFDDGKPVSTNAMGYEVGGYFRRHQEALRLAKAEAERKAEEERLAAEQAAIEEAKRKEEETPTISLEELEAIRNAARNEGYTEGLNKGHEEGYQKGVEQGKVDGYAQGLQEGKEAGYQDGFRVGRDDGYTKGQEAGLAAGSDIVTTQADRFRHLADMLANPLRELDEQVTDETVYIISRLAKVLLKRELIADADFLKGSIEKCFNMLPEAKKGAEILLSEDDYALMVASIGTDYMQSQGWDLKPSTSVKHGDVVVNTKVSSVQWRADDRIDALISAFLSGSADAVASARKEVIDGAPDFDEAPRKPVAPPRDLMGMSERIVENMQRMAPKPHFADEAERNLAAAMGQEIEDDIDPDAAEVQAAASLEGQGDMGAAPVDAGAMDPHEAARQAALQAARDQLDAVPGTNYGGAGLEDEEIPDAHAEQIGTMSPDMQAAAQALQGGNQGQVVEGRGAAAAARAAAAQ